MSDLDQYKYNSVQPGMHGFFSWMKRAVKTVGSVVASFLPSAISSAILDFTDGDGSFYGLDIGNFFDAAEGLNAPVEIPLTQEEEAILDVWVENNFIPVFNSYMAKIDTIKSGINPVLFVSVFNEVYEFIGFMTYFQGLSGQFGQTGYSTNMTRSRNAFLEFHKELLKQSLNHYILQNGIKLIPKSATVQSVAAKWEPLGLELPDIFTHDQIVIEADDLPGDFPTTDQTTNPNLKVIFLIAAGVAVLYNLTTKKSER